MPVHKTPFLPLVTVADAMDANDALTGLAAFTSLPTSGTIMSMTIIDLGRTTGINLDVYLSQATFTATAVDAAFDPSDTDILNCVGLVLIDVWKAFGDSCMGIKTNIGLPYYAPEAKLYTQLITRGTPTPGSVAEMYLSMGIVF